MDRSQKIAILQKIAIGEATREALIPKKMVHRIGKPGSGIPNGLYVNGQLSTNTVDIAAFQKAFRGGKVKVYRRYRSGNGVHTN